MSSMMSRLAFALASTLALAAGCVEPAPDTGTDEAAIGGNLVSTTYYDCNTEAIVGEKTSGCVIGPAAQWGRTTKCFEVDSETCDRAEPVEIRYCAFDNACDAFPFPEEPEEPFVDWLDSQR